MSNLPGGRAGAGGKSSTEPTPGPPPLAGLSQEVQLFGRMAAFGIVVGAAYWFLTYETAGTVLLVAFGLAALLAALAVFIGSRSAGRRTAARVGDAAAPVGAEGPADAEAPAAAADTEPVPRPGWAPVGIALGLGGVAIGLAFGPWLIIAGLLFAIVSAKAWLDAAIEETDVARGGRPRGSAARDD